KFLAANPPGRFEIEIRTPGCVVSAGFEPGSNPAIPQNQSPRLEGSGLREAVCRHHYGSACFRKALHQIAYIHGRGGVEAAGCLIEQNDGLTLKDRRANFKPL